jgi:hypothetical protein
MAGMANVYPNPVENHRFQLRLENMTAGQLTMTIVSMEGRVQQLPSVMATEGSSLQTIVLPSSLRPGIYRVIINQPSTDTRIIKTINVF